MLDNRRLGGKPMGRSKNPTTVPEDAELLAREAQALELRSQGGNLESIAQALGYADPSGAWRAIQRALKRYPAAQADEYRQLQNNQLDTLETETWKLYQSAVDAGDVELALKAQDRLQKWMDRRAKLNGVDAPVKSEVEHKGGSFAVTVPPSRLPDKASQVLNSEGQANE